IILADPQFLYSLRTSIVFTLVNVGLSMLFATLIALLMERVSRIVRILLGAGLVFVWATPVIPAINLWQWMFDYEFGVVNWVLTRIGAGNYIHHNWFENPLQGFSVITVIRSEEHTSELQSPCNLVCRLLLEKKKIQHTILNNNKINQHDKNTVHHNQ